ncbi:hypothetical protein [Succinivibrio dextrinosolvens]|uniref:7(1) septoil knot domain-containing protein n=1 Tax=Succinivibrio dextrinosolvens TaxID=83771 RepID=A0A662Z8Z5_9GAMM|nr:hypothetical protein [Succinivibrio dextrinosolvens]SFJ81126.1 hypothetical protein SAMN04487865_100310 [Succinivibrio dextrinosolvens]
MKLLKIALITLLALSSTSLAGKLDTCSFKGIPLYGKEKVVDAFADIKVEVVNAFSDLDVQTVDAFADSCGKWQFVDAFPDFKVQFVNVFGDIKYVLLTRFLELNSFVKAQNLMQSNKYHIRRIRYE